MMHHFFVQSSTTEISALWAIEVQNLTPDEIQFVALRGYKPFSEYSTVETDKNWTRAKYWRKLPKRERLSHIINAIMLKPGDEVYTPQCALPFIRVIYNGMRGIRINLIEEGTANYIFKVDQPFFKNTFRMKQNEIIKSLMTLLLGKDIFLKFGPKCFFPSYIHCAYLLNESANTDFPNEKRIVADFKSFCGKIAPEQKQRKNEISILALTPLPSEFEKKVTALKHFISYVEKENSLHSDLIIKPHPMDDVASISTIVKDLGLQFEVVRDPIELLNASHEIKKLFTCPSSTALYGALLDIPIKLMDFPDYKNSLTRQKVHQLIYDKIG